MTTPRASGFTLVELVCATAILVVLAALALPVANTMVKRQKELELRQALREIREALDRFQADATTRCPDIKVKHTNAANEEMYPEELKWLVEGVQCSNDVPKIRYLRRLPRDPMTGKDEWGTRSSRDRPDSLFSDGINIFDVYSKSTKKGLNDVPYREW